MRLLLLLPAVAALAACESPLERCVNTATRDLQTVARLKAEVEGNLARGFAYESEVYAYETFDVCYRGGHNLYVSGCWRPQVRTRSVAVPIDVDVEQRKLRDLEQKERELSKKAAPAVKQCEATYGTPAA